MLILLGIFGAALLTGRHHHARYLGAERRRRAYRRDTGPRVAHRADRGRDPRRAVPLPEPRTAGVGTVFGPVTLVWFRARDAWRRGGPAAPVLLSAVNPRRAAASSSATAGTATSSSAPFSSWSPAGGALRRYGTFRHGRDPHRPVHDCCRRCCSITSARVRCSFASLRPR